MLDKIILGSFYNKKLKQNDLLYDLSIFVNQHYLLFTLKIIK
jgi:hypothetical protein